MRCWSQSIYDCTILWMVLGLPINCKSTIKSTACKNHFTRISVIHFKNQRNTTQWNKWDWSDMFIHSRWISKYMCHLMKFHIKWIFSSNSINKLLWFSKAGIYCRTLLIFHITLDIFLPELQCRKTFLLKEYYSEMSFSHEYSQCQLPVNIISDDDLLEQPCMILTKYWGVSKHSVAMPYTYMSTVWLSV